MRYADDAQTQVIFWVKITNTQGYNPVKGRQVRSSVGRDIVDCSDDTYATGPTTLYDSRGRVLLSWSDWEDWDDITPDSVVSALRDFVCEDYDAAQDW